MLRTVRVVALCSLVLGSLALAACGAGRAPVVDVAAPADTPDTGGPYEVAVVIRTDATVKSAVVRWFVAPADAPRPLPLVRDAGTDRWTAGIPGQPAGAVIRFTVEVEDDEGHVVVAPAAPKANQPAPTFQFTVLAPASGG
jgi:hypothetical protein